MNEKKRPVSVVIIACIYILVGSVGFIFHLRPVVERHAVHGDDLLIELTEILAIVAGAFILRGSNWARWLAVAWIAFHVLISYPDPQKLTIHALFFVLITYFLFRPAAGIFFHPPGQITP